MIGWLTQLFLTRTDGKESMSSSLASGTTSAVPKCTTSYSNEKSSTDTSSASGSADQTDLLLPAIPLSSVVSGTSHTKNSLTISKSHEESGEDSTPIPVRWFNHSTMKCPSCKTEYQRIEFDDAQAVCPRCLNSQWLESTE